MKYTGKYFKDSIPAWKKKKDSIFTRFIYRPMSFKISALCANCGISANMVSCFSIVIAIVGCMCFFMPYKILNIIGAVLINLWLILDCVDGNLARSVRKEPFGEFVDGVSSYILVGGMGAAFGVATFFNGGIFFEQGNPMIILMGALASSCDSLMRLIYQKYKNTEYILAEAGVIKVEDDIRLNPDKVGSFRMRIEAELGISGILPLAILVATILDALDIVIIYCDLYFGLSFVAMAFLYISKAMKIANRK